MAYNTHLIDGILISQALGKTGFQASRMTKGFVEISGTQIQWMIMD